MRITVTCADAVAMVAALPSESVDLVLTDPAYESLEKHRERGTTTRLKESEGSSNKWFGIFPNARYPDLFRELYRVLKPERHAYILCDDETSDVIKLAAQLSGFYVSNTLTWVKTSKRHTEDEPAVDIGMGYHYRRCSERIVFLEKRSQPYRALMGPDPAQAELLRPKEARPRSLLDVLLAPRKLAPGRGRQLFDKGVPEVLFFPPVKGGYPTEKPVPLLELLIKQSTELNELVLDPFAGSGSTGFAAVNTGRRAHLGELSPEQARILETRLIQWVAV